MGNSSNDGTGKDHPQYSMGYSNVLCNPYRVLGRGVHTSTVKGVTFDPAGTYLASSGDDPSVCIWRAHDDWGLEKRIDSKSGIFRKWSGDDGTAGASGA
jgi:protein HIRA/HIR1